MCDVNTKRGDKLISQKKYMVSRSTMLILTGKLFAPVHFVVCMAQAGTVEILLNGTVEYSNGNSHMTSFFAPEIIGKN